MNLIGGMEKLVKDGYKVTPYPKEEAIVKSVELNSTTQNPLKVTPK